MANAPKFNPSFATEAQLAEWIRAGDIQAANDVATILAFFLHSLSQNEDARKSLMRAGIPVVGKELCALIAERLFAPAPKGPGKTDLSGAAMFAKFLVPGRPSKSKWLTRYLAAIVDVNLGEAASGSLTKKRREEITKSLNESIKKNNELLKAWRQGHANDLRGWNVALPKTIVTEDEVEKAYRAHQQEIQKANGITRIKTR